MARRQPQGGGAWDASTLLRSPVLSVSALTCHAYHHRHHHLVVINRLGRSLQNLPALKRKFFIPAMRGDRGGISHPPVPGYTNFCRMAPARHPPTLPWSRASPLEAIAAERYNPLVWSRLESCTAPYLEGGAWPSVPTCPHPTSSSLQVSPSVYASPALSRVMGHLVPVHLHSFQASGRRGRAPNARPRIKEPDEDEADTEAIHSVHRPPGHLA